MVSSMKENCLSTVKNKEVNTKRENEEKRKTAAYFCGEFTRNPVKATPPPRQTVIKRVKCYLNEVAEEIAARVEDVARIDQMFRRDGSSAGDHMKLFPCDHWFSKTDLGLKKQFPKETTLSFLPKERLSAEQTIQEMHRATKYHGEHNRQNETTANKK